MNTVRALLLGSDQPGSGRGNDLAERLRGSAFTGPLRALSPAGRTLVDRSLGSVAGRLLDLDLVDLLMAGWRKHTALAEAARATAADPTLEQVVDLAEHRVSSTHRPALEVDVDGVRVATVNFELVVAFTVIGMAGAVRQGRLVALRSGRCEVAASLAVEGVTAMERGTELDLSVTVRLGDGIPLLAPESMPEAPARSVGRVRMFRR